MAREDGRRRGLLVDWGGVMTTSLFGAFAGFCATEGLDPETLRHMFRHDPAARALLVEFECGRLEEEEFQPRLCTAIGLAAERAEGLVDRLFAGMEPDETMIAAVRAARGAGVRTGLVSNSWGTRRYPRALLGELFDGIVISGEVGMRKPAPEMYALGAERIGLAPQECVFVDDLPFNLDPARELGMAVVHHTDAAETVPELERLLGVDLRRERPVPPTS
jgi:epoxide hydrolase-like predicted phosphatase